MRHHDSLGNTIWAHHKPKRSPLEPAAQQIQQQDQAAQTKALGTAQDTLDQFEGPIQDSPYYKALVNTGTQATSNAYEGAKANTRARANAAGFGNPASGVTQGAEAGIENQEAKALSAVPNQAMEAAVAPALQASGQTAQMGEAQGNQGLGYFGDATNLEEEYQKRNTGFQNRLWDIGAGAVAGATHTGG